NSNVGDAIVASASFDLNRAADFDWGSELKAWRAQTLRPLPPPHESQ
ncbi:MAG: hypothetical protein ACI8TQ_000837, partial [Planctomycetota bacterium]